MTASEVIVLAVASISGDNGGSIPLAVRHSASHRIDNSDVFQMYTHPTVRLLWCPRSRAIGMASIFPMVTVSTASEN